MDGDINKILGNALENEADVDTKVSYRLLSASPPNGLGFSDASIRCQAQMAAVTIDKGDKKKSYKPEYVVYVKGFPVIVVEDKAPGKNIANALRECQLYAHELNKQFQSSTNSCNWCLVTDGVRLVVSKWDTSSLELDCEVASLVPGSSDMQQLRAILGASSVTALVDEVRRKAQVFRQQARRKVAGSNNEDVPHNRFGAQLVADYRAIFEPDDIKDREFIAKHAYIKSRHREQHADEIDRIVANAFSVSVKGSKPIRDTGRADEIVKVLNKGRKLENQILLFVGRRGSGKTTFIDYLRVKRLPKDIRDRTIWIHLNLNDAPKGRGELQKWILEELVETLEASDRSIDFNSPAITQKLFSRELAEFRNRVLFNLDENSEAYKLRLTDKLAELHDDTLKRAKALKWYLAEQKEKLLIVVFDNCDKRDRDDQLDCFEVARYVQKEVESLIVLPIRDVTYHLYKDEPPLDASANSLVFTISSPRLSKIISRRIELILDQMQVSADVPMLEVRLAGLPIQFPKNELGFFLGSLYQSLYTHDTLIRSILLGLSGNNIRKAIKIFIEFIRSGFISEHYYLAIKSSEGKYTFPAELVKQVLIRAGRQFFEEQGSFLTNLFQAREGSGKKGNILRALLLITLNQLRHARRRFDGSAFIPFSDLTACVGQGGFDDQIILEEVNLLLDRGLLIADHQRKEVQSKDDRLRISPSGLVHVKLLGDLVYVGACAEDAYLEATGNVEKIAHRLRRGGGKAQYYLPTQILNGTDLWLAIDDQLNGLVEFCSKFHEGPVRDAAEKLDRVRRTWKRNAHVFNTTELGWHELTDHYAKSVFAKCYVVNATARGLRVSLPGKYKGWVPVSRIPSTEFSKISRGDLIECRVLKWDDKRESFLLSFEGMCTEFRQNNGGILL